MDNHTDTLPTAEQIAALWDGQDLPEGVRAHARAVAEVALRLAQRLRTRGEAVDPELARCGGLLHDLDKITSRRRNRVHGELGAEVLRANGYPLLAEIARSHLIYTLLDPNAAPRTWEEKLVYYADKIVEGTRPVGVAARLEALAVRYAGHAGRMAPCRPAILALEREICTAAGLTPEEVTRLLEY